MLIKCLVLLNESQNTLLEDFNDSMLHFMYNIIRTWNIIFGFAVSEKFINNILIWPQQFLSALCWTWSAFTLSTLCQTFQTNKRLCADPFVWHTRTSERSYKFHCSNTSDFNRRTTTIKPYSISYKNNIFNWPMGRIDYYFIIQIAINTLTVSIR